jgi:hypothetical protein
LRQRSGLDEQAPKTLSENPAVLTGKKAKSKDTRHVQAGHVKSSVTRFFPTDQRAKTHIAWKKHSAQISYTKNA